MKKLLLVGSVLLAAVSVYAQGTIVFNNRVTGSVVAPIYGPQAPGSTELRTGNTATGTPAGTQTYSGAPLDGPQWVAQLYGGPLGTADGSLIAIAPSTTFRTGAAAGFVNGITVAVPGVLEGQRAR